MLTPSKCVRTMSSAVRYGNEIDTRKLSTNAMNRNTIPGMQNMRDIVGYFAFTSWTKERKGEGDGQGRGKGEEWRVFHGFSL
jgi:nitric oxide reductase large subunit